MVDVERSKPTKEDVISFVESPYVEREIKGIISLEQPFLLFWGDDVAEPFVAGLYSKLFAEEYPVTHIPLNPTRSDVDRYRKRIEGKKLIGVLALLEEEDIEKYKAMAEYAKTYNTQGFWMVRLYPKPKLFEVNGNVTSNPESE